MDHPENDSTIAKFHTELEYMDAKAHPVLDGDVSLSLHFAKGDEQYAAHMRTLPLFQVALYGGEAMKLPQGETQ